MLGRRPASTGRPPARQQQRRARAGAARASAHRRSAPAPRPRQNRPTGRGHPPARAPHRSTSSRRPTAFSSSPPVPVAVCPAAEADAASALLAHRGRVVAEVGLADQGWRLGEQGTPLAPIESRRPTRCTPWAFTTFIILSKGTSARRVAGVEHRVSAHLGGLRDQHVEDPLLRQLLLRMDVRQQRRWLGRRPGDALVGVELRHQELTRASCLTLAGDAGSASWRCEA